MSKQFNRTMIAVRHGFQKLGYAGKDVLFTTGKHVFSIREDGSLSLIKVNTVRFKPIRTFTQAHEGFEQVQEKIYWGNLLWERFQTD